MVSQLKISFAMGGLLTVGLESSLESLADASQPQISSGTVIVKNTKNKPSVHSI